MEEERRRRCAVLDMVNIGRPRPLIATAGDVSGCRVRESASCERNGEGDYECNQSDGAEDAEECGDTGRELCG